MIIFISSSTQQRDVVQLCTSLQVARQREPEEKRVLLLELVDKKELGLVEKKELEVSV